MIIPTVIGDGIRVRVKYGMFPEKPANNTLWLDTQTAVGWYQVSAERPEKRPDGSALVHGDAWICIGSGELKLTRMTGSAENVISISFESASQYTSEGWKAVPMQMYRDGEWSSAAKYLFKEGDGIADEFTLIGDNEEGKLYVTTDSIIYSKRADTGGAGVFEQRVSGFTTLYFDLEFQEQYSSESKLIVGLSSNTDLKFTDEGQLQDWLAKVNVPFKATREVYAVPVAGLDGYVKFNGLGTRGTIYNVWMQ